MKALNTVLAWCSWHKAFLFIVALLAPSFGLFAQANPSSETPYSKIDSLSQLLKASSKLDSNRVDLQNALGYEYWIVDPGQSEFYGLQSIELASILPYQSGEAMANRVVGVAHWVRGNYELAFRFLYRSYDLYGQVDDALGIANTLLNLGMVHQDQQAFLKAISKYEKALNLFQQQGATSRIATTQTKWGSTLIAMGEMDAAYEKLIAALKIHEADEFLYGIAEVNNKLGDLFTKKKEYNKALSYFLQSVEAGTKRFDHVGIADNYQRIGAIYLIKNDYGQAAYYLEKGKQMAEEFQLKSIQRALYLSLKQLYQAKGDLPQALQYFEKYSTIADSIFNEEKANQIASLETQYTFAQKEKELALAKQEVDLLKEKDRANNLLKIVFVLIALLIGSLVWNVLRTKNKTIDKGIRDLQKAHTKTEALEDKIKVKEGELTAYTLNFVQKNELLQDVKSSLAELRQGANAEQKRKLKTLSRQIDSTVRIDEDWEGFRKHFESAHQGLISNIKQQYPTLTQHDLRLLALIRINLSSKEIGSMLGIASDSVKTARYRLRKKLELETKQSLFDFLMQFEG